jgi:hypothetical protein
VTTNTNPPNEFRLNDMEADVFVKIHFGVVERGDDTDYTRPSCVVVRIGGCSGSVSEYSADYARRIASSLVDHANHIDRVHGVKRLYLAGPMSDLPDLNFPAFNKEAARLRALGYTVVNPAEINGGDSELVACSTMTPNELTAHWRKCMRKDIAALMTCDGIAMLPGWRQSKGACLEHHNATALGMLVLECAAVPELEAA